MNSTRAKVFVLLALFLMSFSMIGQNKPKFKVVLDPGHGGKDTGTNHLKNVEKDIVLAVALEVGKILEKQPDIEVFYTRNKDVFVEVKDRSVMANNANGNVFVSIHCNGVDNTAALGTETFVMGLSKNKNNLEVAKKENSVIMMEDNYKTKYAGFNASSPESIIGLTLIQEDYIQQSIDLASRVQDGFTYDLKRKNRGVKQGPFWVLHGAFMPSVLIELGFVSNKDEGEYLSSSSGQRELAQSIAKGIVSYKNAYYGGNTNIVVERTETKKTSTSTDVKEKETKATVDSSTKTSAEANVGQGLVFKVQIAASGKVLELKPKNFRGLTNVSMIHRDKINRYYYGETSDYNEAKRNLEVAKSKGHTSSFIVAFKDGKEIKIEEAFKLLN